MSLARKVGRDIHINIYFCISMNSGDVNTVTRAIKHYVLSIVFFPLSTFLMENFYEYTIVRVFFFGDIYSDTSGFDFYYKLPAIFSRNLNTLPLKKRVFLSVFLESFFFLSVPVRMKYDLFSSLFDSFNPVCYRRLLRIPNLAFIRRKIRRRYSSKVRTCETAELMRQCMF